MTRRNLIIGLFILETLPLPAVAVGWVFVLCAPGLLTQPGLETATVWSMLMYPVVWLTAFIVASNHLDDPQSRLPETMLAINSFIFMINAVIFVLI